MIYATSPHNALILPGCCPQSVMACTPHLALRLFDWYDERDEEEGMEILKDLGPVWRVGTGLEPYHPAVLAEMRRTPEEFLFKKTEASHCPFCGQKLPEVRLRHPALPDWLATKPWTVDHRGAYQTDNRFHHILMYEVAAPSQEPDRGVWGQLLGDMEMLERILDCLPGERRDQVQLAVALTNEIRSDASPGKLLKVAQQYGPHLKLYDEDCEDYDGDYDFEEQIGELRERFKEAP